MAQHDQARGVPAGLQHLGRRLRRGDQHGLPAQQQCLPLNDLGQFTAAADDHVRGRRERLDQHQPGLPVQRVPPGPPRRQQLSRTPPGVVPRRLGGPYDLTGGPVGGLVQPGHQRHPDPVAEQLPPLGRDRRERLQQHLGLPAAGQLGLHGLGRTHRHLAHPRRDPGRQGRDLGGEFGVEDPAVQGADTLPRASTSRAPAGSRGPNPCSVTGRARYPARPSATHCRAVSTSSRIRAASSRSPEHAAERPASGAVRPHPPTYARTPHRPTPRIPQTHPHPSYGPPEHDRLPASRCPGAPASRRGRRPVSARRPWRPGRPRRRAVRRPTARCPGPPRRGRRRGRGSGPRPRRRPMRRCRHRAGD